MTFKILGAVCILCACGGFGFRIAAMHRYQTKMLRQILNILDLFESELNYRLTPLPELCRKAADGTSSVLKCIFDSLATELNRKLSPNAEQCLQTVLQSEVFLPEAIDDVLFMLCKSLGKYDLQGQLRGIESTRLECQRLLQIHTQNQDVRLRSYQTLGLCAGAALAILFV